MTNTSPAEPYSLVVDGYPLGIFAAIEKFGQVKMLLNITNKGEPIICLTERMCTAIETAYEHLGENPEEISIVCLDDGGDGRELKHLKELFRCTITTNFLETSPVSTQSFPNHLDKDATYSASRVRSAALQTE